MFRDYVPNLLNRKKNTVIIGWPFAFFDSVLFLYFCTKMLNNISLKVGCFFYLNFFELTIFYIRFKRIFMQIIWNKKKNELKAKFFINFDIFVEYIWFNTDKFIWCGFYGLTRRFQDHYYRLLLLNPIEIKYGGALINEL